MRPANLSQSPHFQQERSNSVPVPNPVSVLPRVHLPDTHIRDIPARPVGETSGKWLTLAAAAVAAAVLSCLLNGLPSWAAVEKFLKQAQGHAAAASTLSTSTLSATSTLNASTLSASTLSAASSSDTVRCEGGNLRSTMCQIAYEGGIPALFGN